MAKGMTKWQARKDKKKQKKTASYGEYLGAMKKSYRHKKAMTQYEWMKATPATRKIALQKARS